MAAQNSARRSAQSGPFTSKSKTIAVDPGNIVASTTLDVVIAFVGAKVGDRATVTPLAALEAGIVAGQAQCLVADQVAWRLANVTVGAINPASVNCVVAISTEH